MSVDEIVSLLCAFELNYIFLRTEAALPPALKYLGFFILSFFLAFFFDEYCISKEAKKIASENRLTAYASRFLAPSQS